jgi:peptide/nickel transport system substrate-binding protein
VQSNPILQAFKIAAFGILAFLVWISFWQTSRQEEVIRKLETKLGQMQGETSASQGRNRDLQDEIRGLAGQVTALKDVLAKMDFRQVAPARQADDAGRTDDRPSPANADVPEYFTPEARALWGRFPDYLKKDPDAVVYPDLDQPGVDAAGRLRVRYGDTPSGINPLTTSDARVSDQIELYCLQPLTTRHVKQPSFYDQGLAIRVEKSPDYKEWVVWLREDVLWHPAQVDLTRYPHLKGRHHVTAHDVKFTVDMILNPDVNCGALRSYYTECEGVEVVDDHCFVVRWKKPQYTSIGFTLGLQPIPEFVLAFDESGQRYDAGQIGLAFNDHWFYRSNNYVGCGPYYVASFDPSDHVLLRRFDDFYGTLPPIREIHQQIFAEEKLGVQKLESGEFDLYSLMVKDWEKKVLKETGKTPFTDGSIEERWIWRTSYSFIAWKNTHPLFSDPEVRRAMTLACDRERLRDVLQLGKAVVVTGPQHPTSPFYPPDLEPVPFDLDAAKALLAERGWKDADGNGVLEREREGQVEEFRFTAMVPNNPLFRPIFEIFKEDLDRIGVKVALDFLNWKEFSQRLEARQFECTALLWSGDGWESDLYQIWHSSQIDEVPSSNFIEFGDEEADALIIELRGTFEHEDRVRLQRKLHKRIAALQPYTFLLCFQVPLMFWPSRVGNLDAGIQFATRPKVRYSPMTVRSAGR